mgnify:CR=1 FL=1
MKYLNGTFAVGLLAGISVAVFGALVVAYLLLYTNMRTVAAERISLVKEAELLETQNARTNNIRSLIRANDDLRGELGAFFVRENEIVSFLDDVENLGLLAGLLVNVESVNLGKVLDTDALAEELVLSITAEGSISELFHLLSLFENLPKALSVESVQLTQNATEGFWRGTFKLIFVRLKGANT